MTHKEMILDALKEHGGMTATDISKIKNIPRATIQKRISDLLTINGVVTTVYVMDVEGVPNYFYELVS